MSTRQFLALFARAIVPPAVTPAIPLRCCMQKRYAGHNKWSQIKRAKGAADAARGKLFGKIARQIINAVRQGNGGSDSRSNIYLAAALQQARAVQMPKGNVETALAKGAASAAAGAPIGEQVVYEGRTGQGVSIIVVAITDNRNRTAAEVRHLFKEAGGALGQVMFQFNRRGRIVAQPGKSGDTLEAILDYVAIEVDGVEDVKETEFVKDGEALESTAIEVITLPEEVGRVQQVLTQRGYDIAQTEPVAYIPTGDLVALGEDREPFLEFMNRLNDHDDVFEIFHNAHL
ncbi:transcriptional regulator TACO1-like protein [Zopfochytrium polystomum]|nr:transcriptional regulator TACO1-like protein [Zopfochytrium polystomum]